MILTDEWLPIGSVVHIEGEKGLVVVIGSMQQDVESGRLWDYAGLPYPMGFTDPDQNVMFNKDSIDGVYFLGLQDAEGLRFQDMLRAYEETFYQEKNEQEAALA